MQKREFKTLEEYREHNRQVCKAWYQANKEKKKAYQKTRYYNIKKQKESNQEN